MQGIGHFYFALTPTNYPYQNFSYPYQPFSYTYSDTYSLAFGFNTGYADQATGRQYVIGSNGTRRLGFGMYPNLGFSIALQATGPAIVPQALMSIPSASSTAANYAPYTAGISPGELVVIYGSNLVTADAATQVTIAGVPAQVIGVPLATQLTVLVPPGLDPSGSSGQYAQIQVTIGAQASNIVWALVNKTTPGIFTQAQNGLGDAEAFHSSSNTLVIPPIRQWPARPFILRRPALRWWERLPASAEPYPVILLPRSPLLSVACRQCLLH